MGVEPARIRPARADFRAWTQALAIAAVATLWGTGPLEAAVKVGKTELIVKKVTGELAQKQRLLALKDEVFQNELIAAATASASRIVFLDGTEA